MRIINYLAHICFKDGKRKEQTIKEHCYNVADYASMSLNSIGFHALGYMAGLMHDMGKYSDEFAKYIEAAYGIIAYVAGAHHGEFDIVDTESNSGFEHRMEVGRSELVSRRKVIFC